MRILRHFPFELLFWIMALILLGAAKPGEHHFSLCPLANWNIWCPGCGLGRAISAIFHGELRESIALHWFGIPALLLIVYRMGQLSLLLKRNSFANLNYKED